MKPYVPRSHTLTRLLAATCLALSSMACNATERFVLLKFEDLQINLFVLGYDDPSQFIVTDGKTRIVPPRTILLRGYGELRFDHRRIAFNSENIVIGDKKLLPKKDRVSNFVLEENGSLLPGFIRTFD